MTEIPLGNFENIVNYSCKKYNADCNIITKKECKKKIVINETNIQFDYFYDYFQEGIKKREKLKEKANFKDFIINSKFLRIAHIANEIEKKSDLHFYDFGDVEKNSFISIEKKKITLSVWISENFPLKISHFLPLLNIISLSNSEFLKLKSTLSTQNLPFKSFPLKISYPLGYSLYALLNLNDFNNIVESIDLNENIYCVKESPTKIFDENYSKNFYERYFLEKNKGR